eukprot:GEMP01000859.1.p1 GENE.GEMP01000859.1~~GEMP01000859.1.p1  ORF type:complete len:1498 (+),score=461.22 GEMP01000859.1:219-4496(+)
MNGAQIDQCAPGDALINLNEYVTTSNRMEKTPPLGKTAVGDSTSPIKDNKNSDYNVAFADDIFENDDDSAPSVVSEEMAPKFSPICLENDALEPVEYVFLLENNAAPNSEEDSDVQQRVEDIVLSEDDGTPDLVEDNVDLAAVKENIVPKTLVHFMELGAHISQPPPPKPLSHSPKNARFRTYGGQDEDIEKHDDITAEERAAVRQAHPKGSMPNVQEYHSYSVEDDEEYPTPTPMQFEALHRARADMLQRNLVREKLNTIATYESEDETPHFRSRDKEKHCSDDEYGDADSRASHSSSTAPSSTEGMLEKMKENIDWCNTNVGQDHPVTLSHMTLMAEAEHRAGRVAEAAHRYRIVVNEREKSFPDHPETWRVATDLALLQIERAKFTGDNGSTKGGVTVKKTLLVEAEQLLRKAVAGFALCYGDEHENYWKAKHNLVIILLQRNYIDEALDSAHLVYERYSLLFGASPFTVDAMVHYAIALLKASHYTDARTMLNHCRTTIKNSVVDLSEAKELEARCKYVSGSLLFQENEMGQRCADVEFEDAFRLSEHVQEARAVLTVVRKKCSRDTCCAGMRTTVDRVMRKMALLVTLRRHKNTTYGDFPDGEMFKWFNAVARLATSFMADNPVKNATQAEELYRTALKGYQRLHKTVKAGLGGQASHLQKLYERRSMAVLQQLGDCLATQKTHNASLVEAEECWHQVIYTPQGSNQFALSDPTSDPVYRSAYALSHRLFARGQVSEAYGLFRRFILTPLIVYRHVTQRGAYHRSTSHPDSMYQVGVIARAVELLLVMQEYVEATRLLESIIDENVHTDASVSECVTRAMLLMALSEVYKCCHGAQDVSQVLRLMQQERHRWTDSLVVVVTRHVETSSRQVPMMGQILRTIKKGQVLPGLPPLGLAHLLLNNIAANAGDWYPEAQNCERVVHLADLLVSAVLRVPSGRTENGEVDKCNVSDDEEYGAPRKGEEDSTELGETEDKDDDGSGREEELDSRDVMDRAWDDKFVQMDDTTDGTEDCSSTTTLTEAKKQDDHDHVAHTDHALVNDAPGYAGDCVAKENILGSEEDAMDLRVDAGYFMGKNEKTMRVEPKNSFRKEAFVGWTSIVEAARHAAFRQVPEDEQKAEEELGGEASVKCEQTVPRTVVGKGKDALCGWTSIVEAARHATFRKVPEDKQKAEEELGGEASAKYEQTVPRTVEGKGKEALGIINDDRKQKTEEEPALLRAKVDENQELVEEEVILQAKVEDKQKLLEEETLLRATVDKQQKTGEDALFRAKVEQIQKTKDDALFRAKVEEIEKTEEEALVRVRVNKITDERVANTDVVVPMRGEDVRCDAPAIVNTTVCADDNHVVDLSPHSAVHDAHKAHSEPERRTIIPHGIDLHAPSEGTSDKTIVLVGNDKAGTLTAQATHGGAKIEENIDTRCANSG